MTESRALWKNDHKLHRMANEWVRAVVYGNLSHLDIVSANSLIRVVYFLFQTGFHWNGQHGGPSHTFRIWMTARGWEGKQLWSEVKPVCRQAARGGHRGNKKQSYTMYIAGPSDPLVHVCLQKVTKCGIRFDHRFASQAASNQWPNC